MFLMICFWVYSLLSYFSDLKGKVINSTEKWLETHSYSAGDHCMTFESGFGIHLEDMDLDLNLRRDIRALFGKWIVILLAIVHLLKEFFQLANVSKERCILET